MNNIFGAVELKMLDEIARRGIIVNKKYTDKKKYLNELVRKLYLQL